MTSIGENQSAKHPLGKNITMPIKHIYSRKHSKMQMSGIRRAGDTILIADSDLRHLRLINTITELDMRINCTKTKIMIGLNCEKLIRLAENREICQHIR